MRILITIIFFCSGLSAFAAPLVVRSGDHSDFTRIVIETRGLNGWSVSQTGRRVEIAPNGDVEGYSLDRLFDRITRDRLANASTDGNRLVLDLACECGITSTEIQENIAVFDISSRPPSQEVEFLANLPANDNWEESLDDLSSVFGLLPVNQGSARNNSNSTEQPELLNDLPKVKPAEILPDMRRAVDAGSETRSVPTVVPREPNVRNQLRSIAGRTESLQLNALEQRLARQIGTAATRGLLAPAVTARPETAEVSPDKVTEKTDLGTSRSVRDLSANMSIGKNGNNYTTENIQPDATSSFSCDSSPQFNIGEWGGDTTFQEAISEQRNRLFGEFDQLNEEAQVALAKTYAYYGFGDEAISIIELDNESTLDTDAIRTISEIMADRPSTMSLSGIENCDSDIAMWAILSNHGEFIRTIPNPGIALQALSKLPVHLRQKLAPRLSEAFRKSGNLQAAELAIRTLKRNAAPLSTDAQFESTQTVISSGTGQDITTELEEIVDENAPESPLALAKFIDLSVRDGNEVSEDLVLLAASYDRELAKGENGHIFARAHILALAKNGQFEDSIKRLQNSTEELRNSLTDIIYKLLISETHDVDFLKLSMQVEDAELPLIGAATLKGISERLLELGFPEQAMKFADRALETSPTTDTSMLKAAAHMQLNDFESALDVSSPSKNEELDEVLELANRRKEARELSMSLLPLPIFGALEGSIDTPETESPTAEDNSTNQRVGNASAEDQAYGSGDLNLKTVTRMLADTESLSSEIARVLEESIVETATP